MRRTTLMMASHQAREMPQINIQSVYGAYGVLLHNVVKQSSDRVVLLFPPQGEVLIVKNGRAIDTIPADAFLSIKIAEKPDVQIMSTDLTTVLRVYSIHFGLDPLATHDGTDSKSILVGSEYEARAIGEIVNHLIKKQSIADIVQAQPIEFSGLIELGSDGVWEPKWTVIAGDKIMFFEEKRSIRPSHVVSLASIESIKRLGENRTILPDRVTTEARSTFGQATRKTKRVIVDDGAAGGISLTLRQIEEMEEMDEVVELPPMESDDPQYPIMSCLRHSIDVDILQFINEDVCSSWIQAITAAKDAVFDHFNQILAAEREEENAKKEAQRQARLAAAAAESLGPEPIPLPEDLSHVYLGDCSASMPEMDHQTSVATIPDAYSPASTFNTPISPVVPGPLSGKLVRMLAQGASHNVALNAKAQLFIWGTGAEGQLGLGTSKTEQTIPLLMTSLIREQVIAVDCGLNHTLALTQSGAVYSWGSNTNGQLGTDGEDASSGYPRRVDIPAVRYIAAGGNTSFALSQDGHLYTWGSNANSVMAIPAAETRVNVKKPTIHPTFNGPIRQISIAPDGSAGIAIVVPYSAASMKSKYDVWTWGSNNQGQLGLGPGAEAFRAKTTPVKHLHRIGVNVVQVAMSYGCAACITDTGDLYTWGRAGATGHTFPTDIPTLVSHIPNASTVVATSSGFIVVDVDQRAHVLGLGPSCSTVLCLPAGFSVFAASCSPISGATTLIVDGLLAGNTSIQSTAVAPSAALNPNKVQHFSKSSGGALPRQMAPPTMSLPQEFTANASHDPLADRVRMTRGTIQGGALPRLAPAAPPPPSDFGFGDMGGFQVPSELASDMYRSQRNVDVLMKNAKVKQGRGREVDTDQLQQDVLAAASLMLNMHLVAGGTDREGKEIDRNAFQAALNQPNPVNAPPPPPEPMVATTIPRQNLPPPPPAPEDDLPPPPPPMNLLPSPPAAPAMDFDDLPPPPVAEPHAAPVAKKAPASKFVNKHYAAKTAAPAPSANQPAFDLDFDFPPPPM